MQVPCCKKYTYLPVAPKKGTSGPCQFHYSRGILYAKLACKVNNHDNLSKVKVLSSKVYRKVVESKKMYAYFLWNKSNELGKLRKFQCEVEKLITTRTQILGKDNGLEYVDKSFLDNQNTSSIIP